MSSSQIHLYPVPPPPPPPTHTHTHTCAHAHTVYKAGDELLEINGNSTEGMLHSDAITIIKQGGDVVKLIIRRVNRQ